VSEAAPLIAHIVYRLDFGGLENGLVNLINGLPRDRYRHAIICLTQFSDFAKRIERSDVTIHALHKRPGLDVGLYWRLWRVLRTLRPAIVHTRNLAALECQWIAAAAGVPGRVHGEHGWDVYDLHGTNTKYNRLRRMCRAVVQRYVPMSRDLQRWLERVVRVRAERIRQIYNGVNTERFAPPTSAGAAPWPESFASRDMLVIGTVGRMEPVKDPLNLVKAFATLMAREPSNRQRLRLVLVGDGPLRPAVEAAIVEAGLESQVWLAGARHDVPTFLQHFAVFALPSLNEGISNTVLEAMACGVPVVATDVGGNREIIEVGVTGDVCPAGDPQALASALERVVADDALRHAYARAARQRVERQFSLGAMLNNYRALYDELLAGSQ
jgi:sugar transferase (PEP-CTERM/EpsH1 system associated)